MKSHLPKEMSQSAVNADGRLVPRLTRRDFVLGGTVLLLCGCAVTPITLLAKRS